MVREHQTSDIYIVKPSECTVIYVGDLSKFSSYKEIHRQIRHILTKKLEEQGIITLHAGAVETHGIGIGIGGEKGRGKTTLVLGFLAKKKASYLANDKVYLRFSGSNLELLGWPRTIRVGVGTMSQIPELNKFLRDYTYFDVKYIKKLDFRTKRKFEFTPKELSSILGVDIIKKTKLNCFIFPDLHPRTKRESLRKLSKNEAVSMIRKLVLTPDPDFPDWTNFQRISYGMLRKKVDQVCEKIADVDCYEIKGNLNVEKVVDSCLRLCFSAPDEHN